MSIRDEAEIAHAELTIRGNLAIGNDDRVAFGKECVHLCLLWVLKHPDGEGFGELLNNIRELAEMDEEEVNEKWQKNHEG
jgi:hypothetical protein